MRGQLGGLKVPDPLLVKLTGPVGGMAVPGPMSVTVAVQLVAAFTGTLPGLQMTLVEVGRVGGDKSTRSTCASQVMQSLLPPFMVALSETEPVETVTGYVLVS